MLISRVDRSFVDRSFVDGTLLHFNAVTLPAVDSQIAANGEQLKSTLAKLGDSADGLTAAERSSGPGAVACGRGLDAALLHL